MILHGACSPLTKHRRSVSRVLPVSLAIVASEFPSPFLSSFALRRRVIFDTSSSLTKASPTSGQRSVPYICYVGQQKLTFSKLSLS